MPTPRNVQRDEANWLLTALPDHAYARVANHLEPVKLAIHDTIFEPDASIDYAYFPQAGCLSMITVMQDGSGVEVGTIGREGMSGISLLHGIEFVPIRCIVQIDGAARRMARASFVEMLRQSAELLGIMQRYAEVWTNQVAQSGSCNAVHSVDKRCARWLLMTQDRLDSDVLPLTQEFLSIMLGVRRASVTLAAGSLQDAGLIRYTRGQVTVLDRVGLEAATCECYHAMRSTYERLLPRLTPRAARAS